MNTHFKSALDQIKAEEELVTKTERFLRNELNKSKNNKLINRREYFMKKKLAIAVSLAVVLIGGGGGSAYAYYQTPQSYVSVDINPSVELGVNSFGKVVDVEAYNSDGEKILNGIDVEGVDVTEAVNTIVASAVENGYVEDDTVVSLTSETDDEELATELEENAEEGANEALEESGTTATISKDNVALARRDEARTLGITPGKLNLINKLQAVDPTATVEEYKDASVKEIMKSIKEIRKNNKVSDENQDEVISEDQTEVIDENQDIDINEDQTEETKQNQGKGNDKNQGEENNKKQSAINNDSDNGKNNANGNSNAKNTNAGDNGNSGNKKK